MTNLVIMPAKAKKGMGWSDFAEEATIIEETVKPERANHFIEANTMEIDLQHLKSDCIVPVFSKDNELTISHNAFIETCGRRQTLSLQGKELKTLKSG